MPTENTVLNLGNEGGPTFERSTVVMRSADPVISPAYALPADFAAQFPTPLDTTEIVAMCEEVTLLQWLPERMTGLKQETWRELNELAFTSGSSYISFADGTCPEEYRHNGNNTTKDLYNIGAKKTLSLSDIMHSLASQSAGYGIAALNGPIAAGEGMPGAGTMASFAMQAFSGLKEKEVRLGMTLVMNGWDNLLVNGDNDTNALQFDGIVEYMLTGTHQQSGTGTFEAAAFDRFLGEGCAKPTVLLGHPAAMQGLLSAYFQLGFQGSQVISVASGERIIPGFNFAGFVNTGIGRLQVVSDTNFPRTDTGTGGFTTNIYGLRMQHNGEPLVYKLTQIPLGIQDLAPGCTTIAFELWAKTCLIIKHLCAHHVYGTRFTGNIVTTCPVIL
jgi:hypothetical protein